MCRVYGRVVVAKLDSLPVRYSETSLAPSTSQLLRSSGLSAGPEWGIRSLEVRRAHRPSVRSSPAFCLLSSRLILGTHSLIVSPTEAHRGGGLVG